MNMDRVNKMADLIAAGLLVEANSRDQVDDDEISCIVEVARDLAEHYVETAERHEVAQATRG